MLGWCGLSIRAVDRHKGSHVSALLAQNDADLAAEFQAARQADHRQYHALRKHARAVMRAFEGWGQIPSVEAWQATCEDARERYASGRFLLERLGAERFLDPQLMATLWQLRQGFIEEYGAASPAMTMVIDLVVMTYANALRVQGWIGDLALGIEQELFGEDSLKIKLRQQYGAQYGGFAAEEALRRLREELIPLFERTNQQLVRNLQALQRPPRGALPRVAIGRAGQVNVAQQQVHVRKRDARSFQPLAPR